MDIWYCYPVAAKFRSCQQIVIISLGDMAPAVFLILTDSGDMAPAVFF